MSLYNMINGTHALAGTLMQLLKIRHDAVGRFRDCFLQRGPDGALEIHVYTRNGGGNRQDFVAETEALRKHPLFLRDFDDEMDSTYATYVFSVPAAALETLTKAAEMPGMVPPSPAERMKAFMQKLETSPNDPDVQRVLEAMKPTVEAITKAMK